METYYFNSVFNGTAAPRHNGFRAIRKFSIPALDNGRQDGVPYAIGLQECRGLADEGAVLANPSDRSFFCLKRTFHLAVLHPKLAAYAWKLRRQSTVDRCDCVHGLASSWIHCC